MITTFFTVIWTRILLILSKTRYPTVLFPYFYQNCCCAGEDFRKKTFFQFETSLPQATKQKETCFATRKILQNFERSLTVQAYNFLSHFQLFKAGEIVAGEIYWFYRWSTSSMWCFSCKKISVGDGNLQMITNKSWYKYFIYCFKAQFCA